MAKVVKRKIIVVLGMHRSGTSVITRGLQVLDVSLGNNLMQPIKDNNDKGFYEDIDINALNVELLKFINSEWFTLTPINAKDLEKLIKNNFLLEAADLLRKKISNDEIFAFKDPRVAKLLPFWNEVFKCLQLEVVYVIALRNPFNVAQSLLKRDGLLLQHSYILWASHVLESLRGSIGRASLIVDFDRLLISPEHELKRIASVGKVKFNKNAFEIYRNDFLDAGLRHNVGEIDNLRSDSSCPPLVKEMFNILSTAASDKKAFKDCISGAELDKWLAEFDGLKEMLGLFDKQYAKFTSLYQGLRERDGRIASLNQVLAERDSQIASLNQVLAERDSQIASLNQVLAERDTKINELILQLDLSASVVEQIYSSRSWKITAPIRIIKRHLSFKKPIKISSKPLKLIWNDDFNLKVNDLTFRLSCDPTELQTGHSSDNNFLLGKPRSMVEKLSFIGQQHDIHKIFEMGILHGGSVVLNDQLFPLKKLVAIDFNTQPVESLSRYIDVNKKLDFIKPYYGVNQADRLKVNEILTLHFPNKDIDLIIDDASHLYNETREAFNITFPYLRKGGLYIIEDWAWAHWSGDYWQKGGNDFLNGKTALSNLLIELFMLSASRPDLIKSINIQHDQVVVIKGEGAIPEGKFNISDHYLLRGKRFDPFL